VPSETITLAHRYLLEAPIARGGMATVWRARDDVLARTVAVKVLHAHLAQDQDFLARFRREALAAARLAHPNIVAIYDSGSQADEGGERHYIVLEHCGGGTLADLLRTRGQLPPDEAVGVGATICGALSYAHQAGIYHRDIKPANVLLAADGTLKVADFGIAKAAFASGDITTTGTILGTVTYMAPEQIRGMEADQRSDVYSLGVMMYELLAGRPPFVEEGQLATALAHQHSPPPPLRSFRVGVPRGLEAAVGKALAKDPSGRWQSAQELRRALDAGLPDRAAPAPAPPPAQPPASAPEPGEPVGEPRASELRKVVPVVLFVAVAVALAFALPGLLAEAPGTGGGGVFEIPGTESPGGGEPRAGGPLPVRAVADFDPFGGDGEHPEEAGLAVDGEPRTAWRTSTYDDSFQVFGKPGVGLVLDLGRAREVTSVVVSSSTPGYGLQLRAGSRSPTEHTDLELVDALAGAPEEAELAFEPISARYWLVWITSLPGPGGGSASINEVELLGD
jgi:serine/threonine-protein kinase